MIYNACVSLCRIVARNFLVASNYGRMYIFSIYKRRRTFSLVSVVASGKKYSIVPVYILKHLHTVTLVQSQTIAIREPRDAGRLTQYKLIIICGNM